MTTKNERIVRYTADELVAMEARGEAGSNWKRAAPEPVPDGSDPADAVEPIYMDRIATTLPMPRRKAHASLCIDADVLDCFATRAAVTRRRSTRSCAAISSSIVVNPAVSAQTRSAAWRGHVPSTADPRDSPMNARISSPLVREGVPHRLFTVDEVVRMVEAEIIPPHEKFELVEGEIVPMSPKHYAHERIKLGLIEALVIALPASLRLGVETSVYLSERTFLDPDLSVIPRGRPTHELKGGDLVLAIEVAATTLRYDLKVKAPIYGRAGVQELWVIDANHLVTHVHRGPSPKGWGAIEKRQADALLETPGFPGFSIRLTDIP